MGHVSRHPHPQVPTQHIVSTLGEAAKLLRPEQVAILMLMLISIACTSAHADPHARCPQPELSLHTATLRDSVNSHSTPALADPRELLQGHCHGHPRNGGRAARAPRGAAQLPVRCSAACEWFAWGLQALLGPALRLRGCGRSGRPRRCVASVPVWRGQQGGRAGLIATASPAGTLRGSRGRGRGSVGTPAAAAGTAVRQCLTCAGRPCRRGRLAYLSGPSFAREVALGLPTAVTVAAQASPPSHALALAAARARYHTPVLSTLVLLSPSCRRAFPAPRLHSPARSSPAALLSTRPRAVPHSVPMEPHPLSRRPPCTCRTTSWQPRCRRCCPARDSGATEPQMWWVVAAVAARPFSAVYRLYMCREGHSPVPVP
jgi:hypothetical protein